MNKDLAADLRNKVTGLALCALLLALNLPAEAQQKAKVPKIGFLVVPAGSFFANRIESFRQGLHSLGYVEGKNVLIEYRYAEGKLDRLPELAKELVDIKVDVIVTTTATAVRAIKKGSSTIPIVFAVSDPVGSGLVTSLARPGGNATGLTNLAPELDGKRLELLKEVSPKITRVAFLWNMGGSRGDLPFRDTEAAAKALELQLQSLGVRGSEDFAPAFETAKRIGAQAVLTMTSPVINTARERIVDFAAKNRLPAMYSNPEFVDAGGLMSYGPNSNDLFRRGRRLR